MSAGFGSVKGLTVALVGVALLVSLAAACGSLPGAGDSEDPLEQPDFLTPIAQAQGAGLELYWLGDSFQGGALTFAISGYADLFTHEDQVSGLEFAYGGKTGPGAVSVDVENYPRGGARDAARRDRARSIPGSTTEQVHVGGWDADLFYLPGGARPVNALWLFVDVGGNTVLVQASSGGPGIPGEDRNPLIEKELLIQVVADNLRPYPE